MSVTAMDLLNDMNDVLGENAEASSIRGWLDTGVPELNKMISGDHTKGFPMGRLAEVFGGESSGKTFLATMVMKSVQDQGGIAFFSDHERSFSPDFAEQLGLSLNPSQFRHLKPLTIEDSMDAMQKACQLVREKGLPMDVPLVWVFDSLAAMIPAETLYKRDGKGKRTEETRETDSYNMRDNMAPAAAFSKTLKIVKVMAEDYNCAVLMLNQIRIDPGVMYGNPEKTSGGKAPAFYSDVRISLGKKPVVDSAKKIIGFEVTGKNIKNKVAKPNETAQWRVMYNSDGVASIDQVATNVDYAKRSGIIEQAGSRLVWEGKKPYEKELVALMRKDESEYQKLLDLIQGKSEE